jgi:hypothetical protein
MNESSSSRLMFSWKLLLWTWTWRMQKLHRCSLLHRCSFFDYSTYIYICLINHFVKQKYLSLRLFKNIHTIRVYLARADNSSARARTRHIIQIYGTDWEYVCISGSFFGLWTASLTCPYSGDIATKKVSWQNSSTRRHKSDISQSVGHHHH